MKGKKKKMRGKMTSAMEYSKEREGGGIGIRFFLIICFKGKRGEGGPELYRFPC